jgi:hypothetical protein
MLDKVQAWTVKAAPPKNANIPEMRMFLLRRI